MSTPDATFELEFNFRNRRYRSAEQGLRALARNTKLMMTGVPEVLQDELKVLLNAVASDQSRRHGRAWPGGTTSDRLSKRSGRAIQSIQDSVRVTGTTLDNTEGRIGGVFYLRIHEYGGVIRAKRAKYLTVPLDAALNKNGTPKKRSARQWANTFIIRSKKGNLLIVRKKGKGIEPLYLLVREVRIPKRLGMREKLESELKYFTERAGERMHRKMLANAFH